MNVRVCGPNLRDQRKGTFHVHADGCPDLRKYGPQYHGKDAKGGDLNGNREMLIENATVMAVVRAVYADQIAENPDAEAEMDSYIRDFWFAPCCADWLEHGGEVTEIVYECWVAGDKHSFAKLRSDDRFGVTKWLLDTLGQLKLHDHVHIVVHDSSEYF